MTEKRESFQRLEKAPIKEALIDIFCEIPKDVNVSDFQKVLGAFAEEYPKTERLEDREFGFELSPDGSLKTSAGAHQLRGYLAKNEEDVQVVQYRKDGFTFNRLRPYQCWDDMKTEAKRLWKSYEDFARPKVTKVGLRYINAMRFKCGIANLDKFLKFHPEIPTGYPVKLETSFDRKVYSEPASSARAIVTMATKDTNDPFIDVVFDVDTVHETGQEITESDIWEVLENLRVLKNRIFFSTITNAALEQFK